MPVHIGIKYFTSRVTYTYEDCVQEKTEGYDDVLKLLKDQGESDQRSGLTCDDVTNERGDGVALIEQMAISINEIRTQMNTLNQKIDNENKNRKQKFYSQALKSTDNL